MSHTTAYRVTGMSCGHCEQAIRSELAEIAGVAEVLVSASSGELTVTHDDTVSDADIIAAVAEAGYNATRTSDTSHPEQHNGY